MKRQMTSIKRLLKQTALLLIVAGFTSAASAALSPINLTTLVNGGSLQVGDKIFSDFTWTGPTGPAGITVTGIGDGTAGNLYGIQIGGGLSVIGANVNDWRLGYSVTVAPGYNNLISDIHQYANVNGSAGSLANISEDVLNTPGGQVVASSHVGAGINFTYLDHTDPPAEMNDVLNLATPLQKIWINKDILLQSFGPNDWAAVSIIEQRFSQVTVPEPTTMVAGAGALGLALLGIGRARRTSVVRIGK